MFALHMHSAPWTEQTRDRDDRAGAASNGGGNRGSGNAKLRKWANTEDETRAKDDVDPVGEPQHSHRDGCIACTAEDRVREIKHDHAHFTAEHDAREVAPGGDHAG